ncbi:MAG: hypothetical protein WAN66_18155 [Limnoraphis robusta]|jgi:hypothetical protein|uniref:Uncharacterized protein n=1 Tax=Limnoraphis robusta CS-951 TaxID=1637645 RepID=A0A0F5YEY9_9CYAN|nr:hypothetical protein [Limnoraphis robusta]KKD37192.1 hypothetical protein WN50_15685 [Limnoraphis robusta CS-951]
MLAETSTSTLSLEAIIKRVLTFRQITPLDYQLLKSAILSEQSFSPTTQIYLDQLFESLQRGSIWIVP